MIEVYKSHLSGAFRFLHHWLNENGGVVACFLILFLHIFVVDCCCFGCRFALFSVIAFLPWLFHILEQRAHILSPVIIGLGRANKRATGPRTLRPFSTAAARRRQRPGGGCIDDGGPRSLRPILSFSTRSIRRYIQFLFFCHNAKTNGADNRMYKSLESMYLCVEHPYNSIYYRLENE